MAVKQVVVSDISGVELSDGDHARIIVQHPDIAGAVELDVSTSEAAKLTDTPLRLVSLTVLEPDQPPRSVQMETKVLDRLFADVDFDRVLDGARRADVASLPPSQRPRGAGAAPRTAATTKIDYTTPDHFGQLHRGRVNEEEARLVRADRERASANRQAQGHPPIDFADAAEIKRYGL